MSSELMGLSYLYRKTYSSYLQTSVMLAQWAGVAETSLVSSPLVNLEATRVNCGLTQSNKRYIGV